MTEIRLELWIIVLTCIPKDDNPEQLIYIHWKTMCGVWKMMKMIMRMVETFLRYFSENSFSQSSRASRLRFNMTIKLCKLHLCECRENRNYCDNAS